MSSHLRTIAVAATLILVAGCRQSGERRTAVIEQQWPAAGVTSVEIDAVHGRVDIVAEDVETIQLKARVRVRGRRTEREIERGLVSTRLDGDRLLISERRQRRRSIVIIPFVRRNTARVDYDLIVPPRMNLNVTNVNGRIQISGVDGRTVVRSVNGAIDVMLRGGELTARTVNGRVRAEFAEEFRGARLKTVNGSIVVSLPADSSFTFDVSQVNGSFKSNIPLEVTSSRGSGSRAGGAINGGEFPLELTTVNGSVRVERREAGG
ncbi:MAG TPA: DUF4097 family beta strand repeat-containing protein [Thermoanaerobaculia bacterium]|nr:DUF4097 family beta strand repeat-containing protein [Thermoanaerobaculia bacterium]